MRDFRIPKISHHDDSPFPTAQSYSLAFSRQENPHVLLGLINTSSTDIIRYHLLFCPIARLHVPRIHKGHDGVQNQSFSDNSSFTHGDARAIGT